MNARRLGVLLVAVLALVAAGCGGGGGSNDASSETTTVVSGGSTTDEMTTTDGMTTTDETSTSSAGSDASALTGKCADLAGLGQRIAAAMTGQNADVQDVSKLFDETASQVPAEIRADWEVLAQNVGKILEALKGVDLSSGQLNAEAIAKLQQLSTQIDSQQMQQATAHIEAWAAKNC